jgi:hypothetical protein
VEHGIIPSIDTGKKTWRYKIALADVITYLRKREQVGSMIPFGAVTWSRDVKGRKESNRKSFSYISGAGQEQDLAKYFSHIFADSEDVLTSDSVVEMTGISKCTVQKLLTEGHIKSIVDRPKHLVPKQYLMDFLVTQKFIMYKTDSERFLKILGDFEIWRKDNLHK